MMTIYHLIANARSQSPLVREDTDRHALLDALGGARLRGLRVLTYCIMDTHLHLIGEGEQTSLLRALHSAIEVYTRAHNRRHDEEGSLVRREVVAIPCRDQEQLATTVHYVHDNPRKGRLAAGRQVDYPWSGARAFGGLEIGGLADVERTRAALGSFVARALRALGAPRLTDLHPLPAPENPLPLIVGAAAASRGQAAGTLGSPRRSASLHAARAVAAKLALLEGFHLAQIAPHLGRSRSQIFKLSHDPAASDHAVRVARTLLRDQALRSTLRRAG